MDDLNLFTVVAVFGDGMGHEDKEMPFNQANRLPPLLATFDPILIA
jgi:hypothetical protein